MLVVKQKSNTKKKKGSPWVNKTPGNYTNSFCGYTQNFRNNYHMYSPQPSVINNQKRQVLSNYKEYSNFNGNHIKQNVFNNQKGFITNELRSYLEKYISENQKVKV